MKRKTADDYYKEIAVQPEALPSLSMTAPKEARSARYGSLSKSRGLPVRTLLNPVGFGNGR